jgi:hypothetical protein
MPGTASGDAPQREESQALKHRNIEYGVEGCHLRDQQRT